MGIAYAVAGVLGILAVRVAISRIAGLTVIRTAVAYGLTVDDIHIDYAFLHAVVERAIVAVTVRQAAGMRAARWVEKVLLTRGVDLPARPQAGCDRHVIEAVHVGSRYGDLIGTTGPARGVASTEYGRIEDRW